MKGRGQRGKKKKNNISRGNGSQASPWSKDTKSLPRGGRRNNLVSVYVLPRQQSRFCCCWDDGLDGFTCRDRNEAVGGFLWVLDFSVDQSDCVISCLPFSREGKPPSRKRASGFLLLLLLPSLSRLFFFILSQKGGGGGKRRETKKRDSEKWGKLVRRRIRKTMAALAELIACRYCRLAVRRVARAAQYVPRSLPSSSLSKGLRQSPRFLF